MSNKMDTAVTAVTTQVTTQANNLFVLSFNPAFYLKVIELVLSIICSLFWRIPDTGYSGMQTHMQELIFSHTVPGYLTVFFGLVLIYILGDRPSRWFYYVFYGTGTIQMFLVGWIGVYNCMFTQNDWGQAPLFMAFTNILIGVVMIVDLFYSTGLFGLFDLVKAQIEKGVESEKEGD